MIIIMFRYSNELAMSLSEIPIPFRNIIFSGSFLHLLNFLSSELRCQDPPPVDNTVRHLGTMGLGIGSVVNYTCSIGYTPSVPAMSSKECIINETWASTGSDITCTCK